MDANAKALADSVLKNVLTYGTGRKPGEEEQILPARVSDFFAATEIGHPGNRAKVCTGIANTMKSHHLQEAIRRLEKDRDLYIEKLKSIGAPEVIVTGANNKHKPALDILYRVLKKRQGIDIEGS